MPSPEIIRSVGRPVVSAEPWFRLSAVAASWTPRPTWIGFWPPRATPARDPPVSIWLSVSSNTVEEDLKPMVLALAMLLPVTSSAAWLARRPLMPAKRERSIGGPFGKGVLDGWWSGRGAVSDGLDAGDRYLHAVHVEDRPGGTELDALHRAGALGAVVEGVGHRAADQAAGTEGQRGAEQHPGLVCDGLHLLERGELRVLGEE